MTTRVVPSAGGYTSFKRDTYSLIASVTSFFTFVARRFVFRFIGFLPMRSRWTQEIDWRDHKHALLLWRRRRLACSQLHVVGLLDPLAFARFPLAGVFAA